MCFVRGVVRVCADRRAVDRGTCSAKGWCRGVICVGGPGGSTACDGGPWLIVGAGVLARSCARWGSFVRCCGAVCVFVSCPGRTNSVSGVSFGAV